ncbi:hypothetical protein F7731_16095 [Cytobacillus depressus]|uniref:YusW-like protein n=1 Tax=Cytobacillus depressus TaxID=1602942 RepID=A0A6L3V847_9BACI|nr:YusW family protein [Cytobacillus depressus]KAB2333064.1 hypothetical protein F7731_16095 [Cytobacillus depressus]
MNTIAKIPAILLTFMLFIAGCSSKNEVKNPENKGTGTTTEEQNAANQNTAEVPFKDFDLSVEYAGHKEYEAEYDTTDNQPEYSISDDLNNQFLKGDEALGKLTPLLQQLTFTEDTAQEDAIKEVLQVFNLKDDYQEFDLEVQFNNNSIKKYKVDKTP